MRNCTTDFQSVARIDGLEVRRTVMQKEKTGISISESGATAGSTAGFRVFKGESQRETPDLTFSKAGDACGTVRWTSSPSADRRTGSPSYKDANDTLLRQLLTATAQQQMGRNKRRRTRDRHITLSN